MTGFPDSTPDIPTVLTTETLKTAGGATSNGMQVLLNKIREQMIAVADKVGYSAAVPVNVPAANRVLGSDLAGKSKWMQVVTAMLASGAVTQRLQAGNDTDVNISSTSYTDIISQAITTVGGDLLVWACSTYFATAGSPTAWLQSIRLDSGADAEIIYAAPTTSAAAIPAIRLFTGVGAGAHTVTLRGRYTGTGTVRTQDRQLLVLELKA